MSRGLAAAPAQQRQLLALQDLDSRIDRLRRGRSEPAEARLIEHSAGALRDVARELTALADQLEALRGAREEALADAARAAVDEEIDAARAAMAAARRRGEELAGEHRAALAAVERAGVDRSAELTAAATEREEVAAHVEPALLRAYELARRRLGGLVVVPLVASGACGGCHLVIPAVQLEDIRASAEVALAECPECGRFLVV